MKRRVLQVAIGLVFFVLALLFFVWATLPWDRIKGVAETKLGELTGYQVAIEELDSYWFTGLEASGITLTKPVARSHRKAIKEAREELKEAKAAAKAAAEASKETAEDKALPEEGELEGESKAPSEAEDEDGKEKKPEGEAASAEGQRPEAEKSREQLALDAANAKLKALKDAIPKPIRLPGLRARLQILPLFVGTLNVTFEGEVAGGTIIGEGSRSGESYELELEARDLRLQAIPRLPEFTYLPLEGIADLDIDGALSLEDISVTQGSVKLAVKGLRAGSGSIPLPKGSLFQTLDLETPTKLGNLVVELVVGEEEARDPEAALVHLKTFRHQGKGLDLELKAEGDIVLKQKLGLSRIDVTLGISPKDPFVRRNHLGLVLNNRKVKRYIKDDFIGVQLKGTFSRPEPKAVAPSWDKKRAYLRAAAAKKPRTKPGAKSPKKSDDDDKASPKRTSRSRRRTSKPATRRSRPKPSRSKKDD